MIFRNYWTIRTTNITVLFCRNDIVVILSSVVLFSDWRNGNGTIVTTCVLFFEAILIFLLLPLLDSDSSQWLLLYYSSIIVYYWPVAIFYWLFSQLPNYWRKLSLQLLTFLFCIDSVVIVLVFGDVTWPVLLSYYWRRIIIINGNDIVTFHWLLVFPYSYFTSCVGWYCR